jgi:hypothetical protein
MTHPLTDELLQQIRCSNPRARLRSPSLPPVFDTQAMRAAYDRGRDEQLEQVMKWLDENISNYTDDDYLGDCEPLHKLEGDLKKAMRSQEDN